MIMFAPPVNPSRARAGPPLSSIVPELIHIEGEPFTFDGREFQIPIYDEQRDRILLKFGRQTEKSSSLAIREILCGAYYPGFKILHTTPRDEQVRSFSKKRFQKIVLSSPRLRYLLQGPYVVDNQKDKVLSNGSEVTFRSAFRDPDAVRGYSADLLAIDEYQDMQRDHIPVIEETQSHCTRRREDGSIIKLRFYAGTPKTYSNPIEECWQGSTQHMWTVLCSSCGHYNEQIGIKNIGPAYLKCSRCHRAINPKQGFWMAYGNRDAEWAGYHLNVLLYEHCDWRDIWSKLEGQKSYSTQQFMNEVLGYSYDAGAKVITFDEIRACCDDERAAIWRRPQGLRIIGAGLDWGGIGNSTTVFHAGTYVDGKYVVLAARRWDGRDPGKEIPEIVDMAVRLGCRFIAVDLGAGIRANQDLAQRLPVGCTVIQFHNNDSINVLARWNPRGDLYVISKPRTLARIFTGIKKREISFFKWEELADFANDIECVYEEYNPRTRTISFDHPSNRCDDFLHSLNIGKLGLDIQMGYVKHIEIENFVPG